LHTSLFRLFCRARIIDFTTNSKLAQKPPKLVPARRISRTFRPPQDYLHILPPAVGGHLVNFNGHHALLVREKRLSQQNPCVRPSQTFDPAVNL
jgi:hypothetical protein